MTQRFTNPVIKYTTDTLKTLPGALLYFYENGTSTPKVVYQDIALTTPHTSPIVASSAGVFSPIFLDGTYRVELKSSAGVTQTGWPVDDVGGEEIQGQFDDWSAITSYQVGDIVSASNGLYYVSILAPSLNQEPSISPAYWREVRITFSYNSLSTYSLYDRIQYTDGAFYESLQSNNAGNTPSSNSAWWKLVKAGYAWNNATTYASGVYIFEGEKRYISKQAGNLNNLPSTDTSETWWKPEFRVNLESNPQVIKVRPLTGGGALLAEWCNVLKDAGTYTLPLANSVPVNTLIIITKSDTARNLTPAFDCAGADTIAYLGGTATGINIDVLWDDSIILYSNGTNQWSA